MTNEILEKKTTRYLFGRPMPSETSQIQHWLSSSNTAKQSFNEMDRQAIEEDILNEVKAYTAYPLFYPRPKQRIWKRFLCG
jgi:hypothetical protein